MTVEGYLTLSATSSRYPDFLNDVQLNREILR
jgi:hypothetical protein